MIFPELIPFTAALVNFTLTIFVITRGLRSAITRVYLLWGLSLTVWNFGTFLMFHVRTNEAALFTARFLQFGVIFLPISLAHLCLLIGHIRVSRFFYLGYLLHGALALSNFTNFFIAGVRHVDYAFYSIAGPGFWILALTYTIPTIAVYHLFRKRALVPPLHRRRLTNMIVAVATLILFGINDSLPILGIDKYPLINSTIFPFGSAAAIFYGIIVGYSVLQHHLLDIHVTLSRMAARVVRFLFLFLIGLSLLLVLTVFAHKQFTTFSFFSALGVLMVSAVVASILFPRVFGGGDEALERRILGDRFEYHDQIQGFVQSMQWYSDSNLLLDGLHELLVKTISARSYQIIVLDEKTRAYSMFRGYPDTAAIQLPKLAGDSPIFRFFQKTKADYLAFKIAYAMPGETETERIIRHELKQFDPEFCFPLFSDDAPFGLFLIGEKLSGEPYTPQDLQLLTLLVKSLSLHLNQIRLKNQVLLAQEMDLLGMMSRGMAHDLNNLITPIWTYLQLVNSKSARNEDVAELLPTVTRNVETMRAYIKESLFFSNTQTPQFGLGRLDQTIRTAAELAEPEARQKSVAIFTNGLPEVVLEMDAVLVQRLIGNLLANAIDASPPGAQIQVHLVRLSKTETARDWYRLEIIDNGEGISPENLKQIFIPYFTTKDRGSEKRGFGLGLAICRKIVHLHDGNLNISSKEQKGTTVQVDLPSRQINKSVRILGRQP